MVVGTPKDRYERMLMPYTPGTGANLARTELYIALVVSQAWIEVSQKIAGFKGHPVPA